MPKGLAKQNKIPYGWSKGNAWWKNNSLSPQQMKALSIPQRQRAINHLNALKNPTPSQIETLKNLRDSLSSNVQTP